MSLRRLPAARVEQTGFWISAQHCFTVTSTRSYTLSDRQYRRARDQRAQAGAALIAVDGQRNLWWTDDGLYWADAGHDAEEVSLLVWDRSRRQDARLERLRSARARAEAHADADASEGAQRSGLTWSRPRPSPP